MSRPIAFVVLGGAVALAGAATARAVRGATGEPRVKEVPVRLARLPPALSGLTLAQISDLHVGPTIGEADVRRVVDLTNAARARRSRHHRRPAPAEIGKIVLTT